MLKRDGFALLQVMAVLGVGLGLFAYLLPIAIRSSKSANTAASATRLHTAVLRARFALAETDRCAALIDPKAGFSILTGGEVGILDPNQTVGDLLRGQNFGGPTYTSYPDLIIQSVQITNPVPFFQNADIFPLPGTETRYIATVVVTAQRRTNAGVSNFMGSATITEQFPIIYQSTGATIQFCSSRSNYMIAIGPGTVPSPYKSVLECIDRDGTPAYVTSLGYFVCQIPQAPGTQQVMLPLDCSPAPNAQSNDSPLYHEGWRRATVQPVAPSTLVNCI